MEQLSSFQILTCFRGNHAMGIDKSLTCQAYLFTSTEMSEDV